MSLQENDVFTSYARQDNPDRCVEAFIRELEKSGCSPGLKFFLDHEDVEAMDDWESRIKGAVKDCKVMIALVSPNYFDSEWCRKEWEIYTEKRERHLRLFGNGIAPIYVETTWVFESCWKDRRAEGGKLFPEYFPWDVEEAPSEFGPVDCTAEDWINDLRARQRVDVRDWRQSWREFFEFPFMMRFLRQHILRRAPRPLDLPKLDARLRERIESIDKAEEAETEYEHSDELSERDPQFVGRQRHLRRIREFFLESPTKIVVLHGLPGVGKSELSKEYAHTFAGDYPGGRIFVKANGLSDPREKLIEIAEKDPKRRFRRRLNENTESAFARVRHDLEQGPRLLLIFDNLDTGEWLQANQRAHCLPSRNVDVLITSQQPVQTFPESLASIEVDSLTIDEGMRLLHEYRPFRSDEEETQAAEEVVRRLGGHALAIRFVGVLLKKKREFTYTQVLSIVRESGYHGNAVSLDEYLSDDSVIINDILHPNRVLFSLLDPLFDDLDVRAKTALEFASLLPGDQIALPWIEELIHETDADKADLVESTNEWRTTVAALSDARLLVTQDGKLGRMHQLVQDVVRFGLRDRLEPHRQRVLETAFRRAKRFTEHGHWYKSDRWEIAPLQEFARILMTQNQEAGIELTLELAPTIHFIKGRSLLQQALDLCERLYPGDHPLKAEAYAQLAIKNLSGDTGVARKLMDQALAMSTRLDGDAHETVGNRYRDLAMIACNGGDFALAREYVDDAIRIHEESGTEESLVADYSVKALIVQNQGDGHSARELYTRVKLHDERVYGSDHPRVAAIYSNLGSVERALGDYDVARELLRRSLELTEISYGADSPHLIGVLSNLGLVEDDLGDVDTAKQRLERALGIALSVYDDADYDPIAILYSNLGLIEDNLGNIARAREFYSKAVDMKRRLHGDHHSSLIIVYYNWGDLEFNDGNRNLGCNLMHLSLMVAQKARVRHLAESARRWLAAHGCPSRQ